MPPTQSDSKKPPAYNSLRPSQNKASVTEANFNTIRDGKNKKSEVCNLFFTLTSETLQLSPWNPKRIFRSPKEDPAWHGSLSVWSSNIPNLMLHGLHWSPKENVIPGTGHLTINESGMQQHRRCYRYLSPSKDWWANLNVYSWDASVVTNFDLDWVTKDTVTAAKAWNGNRMPIYGYEEDEDRCFNTIYDRMPMEGWWPWPKADSEADDTVEEKDEEKEIIPSLRLAERAKQASIRLWNKGSKKN